MGNDTWSVTHWCLVFTLLCPAILPTTLSCCSCLSSSLKVLECSGFFDWDFLSFYKKLGFFASNLSKLVLRQVLFRGHDANAYSIIHIPVFFIDCVARQTGILMLKHANLAQPSQPRTRANTWKTHTQTVNNEQNEFMRQLPVISPIFKKLLDLNQIPSLSLQNSLS